MKLTVNADDKCIFESHAVSEFSIILLTAIKIDTVMHI